MIISEVCKIQPDHYKVCAIEGKFQVGSVVRDYRWPGELMVLRFVGENVQELVAECIGQDESGRRIIRFLVVEKLQVYRPEELVRDFRGRLRYRKLPQALEAEWYFPRGMMGNDVPLPHYSFPFSESFSLSQFSLSDSDRFSKDDISFRFPFSFC
jgi:hypothetical protein